MAVIPTEPGRRATWWDRQRRWLSGHSRRGSRRSGGAAMQAMGEALEAVCVAVAAVSWGSLVRIVACVVVVVVPLRADGDECGGGGDGGDDVCWYWYVAVVVAVVDCESCLCCSRHGAATWRNRAPSSRLNVAFSCDALFVATVRAAAVAIVAPWI